MGKDKLESLALSRIRYSVSALCMSGTHFLNFRQNSFTCLSTAFSTSWKISVLNFLLSFGIQWLTPFETRLQRIMVLLFIILNWIKLFWWIQLPWFPVGVSHRGSCKLTAFPWSSKKLSTYLQGVNVNFKARWIFQWLKTYLRYFYHFAKTICWVRSPWVNQSKLIGSL